MIPLFLQRDPENAKSLRQFVLHHLPLAEPENLIYSKFMFFC